jgi:Ala-tRNA(Pro) deacylase
MAAEGGVSMAGRRATAEPHGIEAVTRFLEARGVRYEVIEHDAAYSAVAEARAAGADPAATAKTVALHDRDGYRLAVVPASERLDLRRARELLGASHHLRLATEQELGQDFPAFDLGALPPFAVPPIPEVVDLRLVGHERIVCAAGEQRRSVLIATLDLLRITEPRVADISASSPKTASRPASCPPPEHRPTNARCDDRRGAALPLKLHATAAARRPPDDSAGWPGTSGQLQCVADRRRPGQRTGLAAPVPLRPLLGGVVAGQGERPVEPVVATAQRPVDRDLRARGVEDLPMAKAIRVTSTSRHARRRRRGVDTRPTAPLHSHQHECPVPAFHSDGARRTGRRNPRPVPSPATARRPHRRPAGFDRSSNGAGATQRAAKASRARLAAARFRPTR